MIGKFLGKLFGRMQHFYQVVTPWATPGPKLPAWLKLPNLHSFNFILLHCELLLHRAGTPRDG
jgi:hypothetical protein